MVQLYFDPTKVPRATKREEWRAIDRWCRITRRQLNEETQKRIEWLSMFGTTHPDIALDVVEGMINPVLVLGPHQ